MLLKQRGDNKTLLAMRFADAGCFGSAGENFQRFVQKFTENNYQNYKGRNSKRKRRFEFVRIK